MVEFEYKDGRRRRMRQVFATALTKLGHGQVYQTSELKPAPAPAPEPETSPVTGKPKRKYQRRDMKAED